MHVLSYAAMPSAVRLVRSARREWLGGRRKVTAASASAPCRKGPPIETR